jgi:hypothetical protein
MLNNYHNIKILITVLVGFIHFIPGNTFAQKVFFTKRGEVIVSFNTPDTTITARSKDLLIQLDYEKATVNMIFEINTFRTGIDSLDEQIKSVYPNELYLDGNLGIEPISTKPHPTQNFDFNGNLYFNSMKTFISGKGKLEHISDNNDIIACMLWLAFKLDIKNIKWDLKSYGVNDNIQVEIIQGLLKKAQ